MPGGAGDYADSYFPMSVDRWPNACTRSPHDALSRPAATVELIWQIAELARLGQDGLGSAVFVKITDRLAHGVLQVVRPADIQKLLTIFREAVNVTYVDLVWFEKAVLDAGHEVLNRKVRRKDRSQSAKRIHEQHINLLDTCSKLMRSLGDENGNEVPLHSGGKGKTREHDIQDLREAMLVAVHGIYKYVRRLTKTAILEVAEANHRPSEIDECYSLWRLSFLIEEKDALVREAQCLLRQLNQQLREAFKGVDTSPLWRKDPSRLVPLLGEICTIAQKIRDETPVYARLVGDLEDLLEVDASGYDPAGKFPRPACVCEECSVPEH